MCQFILGGQVKWVLQVDALKKVKIIKPIVGGMLVIRQLDSVRVAASNRTVHVICNGNTEQNKKKTMVKQRVPVFVGHPKKKQTTPSTLLIK